MISIFVIELIPQCEKSFSYSFCMLSFCEVVCTNIFLESSLCDVTRGTGISPRSVTKKKNPLPCVDSAL